MCGWARNIAAGGSHGTDVTSASTSTVNTNIRGGNGENIDEDEDEEDGDGDESESQSSEADTADSSSLVDVVAECEILGLVAVYTSLQRKEMQYIL